MIYDRMRATRQLYEAWRECLYPTVPPFADFTPDEQLRLDESIRELARNTHYSNKDPEKVPDTEHAIVGRKFDNCVNSFLNARSATNPNQ